MVRKLGVEIFMMLGIGLVLGLFGPFGTFEMGTPVRILYWMVFALVGYAIFRPIVVTGRWVADALHVPHLIGIGLGLVIAAVPMTFLVALLFTGFDVRRVLQSGELGTLYFDVWLIGFIVNGLFALLFNRPAAAAPAPAPAQPEAVTAPQPLAPELAPVLLAEPAPDQPTLAGRLPPGFGPLLALKGEDHYVRAYAPARDTLILMRLRDAVAELDRTGDGMQVHRSWWVARAAIAGVQRDGRTLNLRLSNGVIVPVSRDAAARLKQAQWV